MTELSEKIISLLVQKKTIMERYLTNPIKHTNEIYSIIQEYDNWKNEYLKECDETDFKTASIKHKDVILRTIMDIERYYDTEYKNCSMSEISNFLSKKRKEILTIWGEFENLIYE